ncbi:MAG TPA: putative sulfate exporter family transporter [Candidatus Saccharimonadales bacterium]|nr:putative sulfate exporter family transporter [Candidatus Saccharimonadales bacterium]
MNTTATPAPALRKIFFLLAAFCCLAPAVSAPVALLAGFLFTCLWGHPYQHLNHRATGWLLKIAVVGLGFGMNAQEAFRAGEKGFTLTFFSILSVLALGFGLGRLFRISPRTTGLVSSGTAICGGSAIAAIAPVIGASEKDMSVALGTVFALNAVALVVFPAIGHALALSQYQFGLWSAIAIQDTSSVVGAASVYGKQALAVATAVKLARALWIVPVALIFSVMLKGTGKRVPVPWFIGLFILAMAMHTWLPFPHAVSGVIAGLSKSVLVMTLFLIGSGLSVGKIREVGWKPFLLGLLLWVFISLAALYAVMHL